LPDGKSIAFAALINDKTQIWVRDLDSLTARPLAGTEDGHSPFWSPDSRFLGFFANRKLKKIPAAGGPVFSLADAALYYGATWSSKDVIVFYTILGAGLSRVLASGGAIKQATTIDQAGEFDHRYPCFLPDGRHFLYTSVSAVSPGKTGLYIADLESKARVRLLAADSNALYAEPGYLLFDRDRTLMAQPFNPRTLELRGDPIPIAEQLSRGRSAVLAASSPFSASQTRVLAYFANGKSDAVQLAWYDRTGKMVGLVGQPGDMFHPSVSPDGTKVSVDRLDAQKGRYDIWIYDVARGTPSRFTFGSDTNNRSPVWSPDGNHIAFASGRNGSIGIYQKATSGAASEELLHSTTSERRPVDWSRDGRYLIEEARPTGKTLSDIWVSPLFGDRKPFPFLQTEFTEGGARLSPDGRWLAYYSTEAGRAEIYVRSFPAQEGKWQVSTDGGLNPVWRRDGKELFFFSANQTPVRNVMVVEVKSSATFQAGPPKSLFEVRIPFNPTPTFDLRPDGRFVIPTVVEHRGAGPMTVVINWTQGLIR